MTGPPDDRTDAVLLRAHAAGDPDAFTELVRRHRGRLWAVALRTLGDPEEAADALQDALLSAYRAAGRFRGDSAVTTWLHRIVINACLDRARRRAGRPVVPLASDDAVPAHPVDHDTGMDVRAALATLPVEQRAALVLVDMYGYAVVEAAAILGVPDGTVKSRCARGRARLAAQLGYLRNPGAGGDVRSEPGGVPLPEAEVGTLPEAGVGTLPEAGVGTVLPGGRPGGAGGEGP